jgi:arabinogalactan endo-1,4-beta-galactosidase
MTYAFPLGEGRAAPALRTLRTLTSRALGALASLLLLLGGAAHGATFASGADVSWVDQEEAAGHVFRDAAGTTQDPFLLLKNIGMNAIRLRVWVSPAGGWCDAADTLYKAQRAAAQGQRVLIDFHYSDSWADPGQQTPPAAWAGHTVAQLNNDVYQHTVGVLNYLKSNGVSVSWVQVGNEINGGMLWPAGRIASAGYAPVAGFINSGYNAVKAVFPSAPVIVHLANGYDDAGFRRFFDGVKAAGGRWDVTGLSHYPPVASWASYNSQILATMKDMVARHGKPVMVMETGMDWTQAATSKAMSADLIAKTTSLGANGLGVFYWEPQAYPGWQGYTLGATDNAGKFTQALDPY